MERLVVSGAREAAELGKKTSYGTAPKKARRLPPPKRMVEIGRVVFIARAPNEGKLAAIINIIDGNKVLLDGPSSGVLRCVRNLKDLQLTKFKLAIHLQQRTKNVQKAWETAEINKKWAETKWAKKLSARKIRANLTDFERYKLMRAKQCRNRLVRRETATLKQNILY